MKPFANSAVCARHEAVRPQAEELPIVGLGVRLWSPSATGGSSQEKRRNGCQEKRKRTTQARPQKAAQSKQDSAPQRLVPRAGRACCLLSGSISAPDRPCPRPACAAGLLDRLLDTAGA